MSAITFLAPCALLFSAVGASRAIEGVVLNSDGKPVQGATVLVAHTRQAAISYVRPDSYQCGEYPKGNEPLFKIGSTEKGAGETKTDRRGGFSFKDLRKGKYSLLAFHVSEGIAQIAELEAAESSMPVEIRFEPPTFIEGRFHGYVPRKSASWFSRARRDTVRLVFVDDPGLYGRSPRTPFGGPVIMHSEMIAIEPDGRFRLGPLLVAGNYAVRLEWANYDYSSQHTFSLIRVVNLPAGKTTQVDIHLSDGMKLSGQVFDESGKPMAHARVQLVPDNAALEKGASLSGFELADSICRSEVGTYLYGMEADDKGRFEVRGLLPGTYTLFADRLYERSEAGKMGTVCEVPKTEFFIRRTLAFGNSPPDFQKLTITQADRDLAVKVDEVREAAEREWQEKILASQRAAGQ